MARPLDGYRIDDDQGTEYTESSRRVDRSAAMAFGAAIASLVVAAIVVNQSASALEPQGAVAGNNFEVGTISLVDDDEGRSLVDLDNMVPGRPAQECIQVTYEGSLLPVELTLAAEADGELARHIMVEIDRADDGGFGRCDAFVATERLYDGLLADMAAADPLLADIYRNQGESTSFRFRFELLDEAEAMGQASTVDFRWEATPR